MQRRTFLALALSIAGSTLLAGCGGGDGGSTSTVGRGAAEGFLFVAADGALRLLSSAAEGVSAGLSPASGVRAEIVGGGASATTGSGGRLQLSNIEAGLRTLRLTPNGSGTPLDIPLTVIPDAVLPLGQTPISRQQAVDALQALAVSQGFPELLATSDVMASSTPLPAGITLGTGFPAGEDPLSIDSPSWLVYVDRNPGARFGHRTLIALVDAQTGAITGIDSLSWPTLNGASFYAESTVNATSPDAVRTATRRVASSPQASLPPRQDTGTVRSSRAATCRAKDPDTSRTHVLMVQGFPRNDFAADMDTVDLLLSSAPFPQLGTLRKIKPFESAESARDIFLREFAAVRDACKSSDTLVLFVTSHGAVSNGYPAPSEGGRGMFFKPDPSALPTEAEVAATYRLVLKTGNNFGIKIIADGSYHIVDMVEPSTLDFSGCKACRIILWIDTCFSGNWIPIMKPPLEALPHKDILILTAADAKTEAQGGREEAYQATVDGQAVSVPTGGVFSQSLIIGASRLLDSSPAETGADALLSAFPFAFAASQSLNSSEGTNFQNPTKHRRALEEGDVCGRGDQEVTIK